MIDNKRLLAEEILIRYGVLDYERERKWLIERLGEFETANQKEPAKTDTRLTNIDQDNPNLRLIERHKTVEGVIRERPTPSILGQTNEAIFDDPQKISEE